MKRIVVQALMSVALSVVTCSMVLSADGYLFDSRTVILESTVQSIDWQAPNVQMSVTIPDGHGGAPKWTVQAASPAVLERLGWKSSTIKAGDKLDLVVNPDKNDKPVASLLGVIFSDARMLAATDSWQPSLIPPGVTSSPPPTPDPMVGYYGNTVVCKGPSFDCHAWFSTDHRFVLFSRDQQPDGSNPLRGMEGTWWLQKLQNAYFKCFVFDGKALAPICHGPVNFEKVWDEWEVVLPNGVREVRHMLPGRQ